MDFKQHVVKKTTPVKSEHRIGIIKYKDGVFYARLSNKDVLPIPLEDLDIENTKIIYCKPENLTYCEWFAKPFAKVKNKGFYDSAQKIAIMKSWSRYKEGDKVYGDIVDVDGVSYFKIVPHKR